MLVSGYRFYMSEQRTRPGINDSVRHSCSRQDPAAGNEQYRDTSRLHVERVALCSSSHVSRVYYRPTATRVVGQIGGYHSSLGRDGLVPVEGVARSGSTVSSRVTGVLWAGFIGGVASAESCED